jgi:hypothetical protein
LQNQELQSDPGADPMKISEVFQKVTDSVWGQSTSDTDATGGIIRRNLQREHLRRLCQIVLGDRRGSIQDGYGYVVFAGGSGSVPADAKSLARMHLQQIKGRINQAMDKGGLDDTTKAHFGECRERIAKTLEANYQAND